MGLALLLGACGLDPDPTIELKGPTMGTYYAIKTPRPPAGLDAQDLQKGVQAVLDAVIAEISTYDPHSDASPDSTATRGATGSRSRPTCSRPWWKARQSARSRTVPSTSPLARSLIFGVLVRDMPRMQYRRPEAVRAARERVGASLLELRADPPALRKQRGDVYIDLSALGEGEGADRLAAYLESRGVTDYMVAVAGTLKVRGKKNPKGEPWGIAIEEPRPDRRAVQRILPITDRAISTSGDYRNFFEEGGRRYSHHIDPRTGAPVAQRLASVSVVLPAAPRRRAAGGRTRHGTAGPGRGKGTPTRRGPRNRRLLSSCARVRVSGRSSPPHSRAS